MRTNWAGGAAGWVKNERIFDAVFAPVTERILAAAELGAGQRVLDVGCGTGTLLKASVDAGAEVCGVDIAEGMAEAARRRVPESTVFVGDAQTVDLLEVLPGRPFDRVVSRFGVMFFDDSVAAFANLRRAAAAGAKLAFACWRTEEENPMFTVGNSLLYDRLDPKPAEPGPGEPGPSALADPERTARILSDAGWSSVAVEPLDFVCDYGIDGSDGVEERLAGVLNTGVGRLAREQLVERVGEDGWNAAVEEVREALRARRVDGVFRVPGAVWIVTARNE
ncbi:class I SAM-dependent methyltransferase [Glycomyces sp. NPDC046736]|uniref:class I SAM-dependent methyltransferase n=1 Tax=Glycomyces sp. NPDC046736 TaxID=3155615 RepID=UPI0033E563B6